MIAFIGIAAAVSATVGLSATAQDDHFKLINNSSWEVHAFHTYEHGKWSKNWLNGRVSPGRTWNLWFNEEGNCEVLARVTYAGGDHAQATIDFCEARTIYVTDEGIEWE